MRRWFRRTRIVIPHVDSFGSLAPVATCAIRYFTAAAPDELALLSPEKARALGIDVFENNDGAMTTPKQAPTADSHADAFVSYSYLQTRCSDVLSVDKDALAVGIRRAFDEGNKLVGPDKWIDLWTPMLDDVKRQVSEKGILGLCLETVEALRNGGQPTGISGPSFDCGKAATQVEQAICGDQGLWAKDRAMNQLYLAGRAMPAAARKRFLDEQRAWMSARDRCSDRPCVHQAYDQRLGAFRKVDLSQPGR
ncbi:lysozyme inhibitor LprI family protein [Bosea sp. WAO]|uniref:lysozyme inhibitor LprI family protein n=1 Tax=Bosea sp. WAO TaxID=406341 RepID=UPI0018DEC315|nr:lysozyme inhibitor LprI family protein [Bosea sp. WAO]